MGFQTQSPYSGQAYSMASVNSVSPIVGGLSRQAYPLQPINPIGEMPLASQKSIYSLTLEEFQNTLGEPGKSFGSMNMEELLKNIWTAEEGQAMATAMGTADVDGTGICKQASLQRQGSLSVRGAIGLKTVDEVWKSVYQGPIDIAYSPQCPPKRRELTFREVTLEDFLVKAGIVSEEDKGRNTAGDGFSSFVGGNRGMEKSRGNQFGASHGVLPSASILPSTTSGLPNRLVDHHQSLQIDATPVSLQPADLIIGSYQNAGIQQHGQLFRQAPTPGACNVLSSNTGKQAGNGSLIVAPMGLGGLGSPVGGIVASLNAGASYSGFNNPLSLAVPTYKMDSPLSQSSDGTGTSQGNMPRSPAFQSGLNGPHRKRLPEGQVEVVERRQRRMIKNRESAARSRARKQAYTVELENELTDLRAENTKLKQKQEKAEKQMKKVIATSQEVQKEDKILRRTRTGPW